MSRHTGAPFFRKSGRDQFGSRPLQQAYFKREDGLLLNDLDDDLFEDAPSASAILYSHRARPECLRNGRARTDGGRQHI